MYNFAIIGCGRISSRHIHAIIDNHKDSCLVACCDIILERARDIGKIYLEKLVSHEVCADREAKNFRPKFYCNYKEMVEREEIDIIVISSESGYHAEIAVYCMNKGKHVIVEKPMALSTADANLMIRTAMINNVKLSVSHQNRFNPPVQKLRQALNEGRFGKIISGNARVLWNRDRTYYEQAPWRGTYDLDGGCLMNQCIHNIDLLQWLLGEEVEWVHGAVGNYCHPYVEAEDYGSIQIKFKNGAIGNVEGTVCTYPENLEETLTIIGEKGLVVLGGLAVNKIEKWRFEDSQDLEEEVIQTYNLEVESVYGSGHSLLFKDMIDCLRENKEPYINGESGKRAMEIVLAAYLSNREEKRVVFPLMNFSTSDFK